MSSSSPNVNPLKSWKEIVGNEFFNQVSTQSKTFSEVNGIKSVALLVFDYAVILLFILLSEKMNHPLIYTVAIIIIAGRQHGLLCLLHEAVHGLLFKNRKLNNWAAEALCILPLGNCFRAFSWAHLNHHKYLNTENDPEWHKKRQQGWHFPKSKSNFLKFMFMECVVRNTKGRILKLVHIFSNPSYPHQYKIIIASYYFILATLIIYFNLELIFLTYWLVPFLLILPYISFTRSLSEHFGLLYETELSSTRNVKPSFLNQIFIPHGTPYHLTHHLFPTIPSYHLSKLTKLLMQSEGFQKHQKFNKGYYLTESSVLKDVIEPQRNPI